jgi:hypothetical protein
MMSFHAYYTIRPLSCLLASLSFKYMQYGRIVWKFGVKKMIRNWILWFASIIPATWEEEVEELGFKTGLDKSVKAYLKSKLKKKG